MKTENNKVKNKSKKEFLKNKLIQLLYIAGVSGDESRVAKYLNRELNELDLEQHYTDSYGNIHATMVVGTGEGATIHLNSHMDTVAKCQSDKHIAISNENVYRAVNSDGTYGVLGADDRAGIANILTILNFSHLLSFNGKIKVSFYREEEIGCVGSSNSDLDFLKDVDFSITFDRHGSSDIVVGGAGLPFACNEVGDWLEKLSRIKGFEYEACEGGISDACTVSETGVNAINLSVGYYNEHTTNEYLIFKELYTSLEFGFEIINDLNNAVSTFTKVPKENKWVQGWGSGFSNGYGYDDYYYYPDDARMFEPTVFSDKGTAVITDGSGEIVVNYDEIDSLISQLRSVQGELTAYQLSDYKFI